MAIKNNIFLGSLFKNSVYVISEYREYDSYGRINDRNYVLSINEKVAKIPLKNKNDELVIKQFKSKNKETLETLNEHLKGESYRYESFIIKKILNYDYNPCYILFKNYKIINISTDYEKLRKEIYNTISLDKKSNKIISLK